MKNFGVKKLTALLLVLILSFALLCGCGSAGTGSPDTGATDTGATDAATETSGDVAMGDAPETIKIGFVLPLSGPMANFSVGIYHAADLALAAMNADGGMYIKEYDTKIPVEVIWGDSESNSTKASEVATKIATEGDVDILVAEWTPATINPVSVVGERYQIPTLVANGPDNSWLANGPYEWSFALLFNQRFFVEEYFNGFDQLETNKKIGLVLNSSVDGVNQAALMVEVAGERDYEIVDPGRFPEGTADYSSVIAELKSSDCDIMCANLLTPELNTLWNQCVQLGYQPKIVVLAKGMHFTNDVMSLGIVNNCIETQWSPDFPFTSSLLGLSAAELSADYEEVIGEPADLGLGWDYSIFDVLADVLQRAQTLDPTTLRDTFATTDLDCIYGNITFLDNHVGYVPIVFGQWVEDDTWGVRKAIVAAGHVPEITEIEEMLPMQYD